jgi:hypothetical protein
MKRTENTRWLAWVPIAGNDDTIDHKLNNPWSYASRAHLVPTELGPQHDGNYSTKHGKAACGATVPDVEGVIEFLDRLLNNHRVRYCKKCTKLMGLDVEKVVK